MATTSRIVRDELAAVRELLSEQVDLQFAPELHELPDGRRDASRMAIDALFQFESLDFYRRTRNLSGRARTGCWSVRRGTCCVWAPTGPTAPRPSTTDCFRSDGPLASCKTSCTRRPSDGENSNRPSQNHQFSQMLWLDPRHFPGYNRIQHLVRRMRTTGVLSAGDVRRLGAILRVGGCAMVRTDRIRVRLYAWVKLLLAAVVTMGVATTGIAIASAGPASATSTPTITSVNANYSLIGTGLPKAFTGTVPANQTDATLTSAVSNPSTATTLAFTSISDTYNFSPVGDVDVYAACSDTATGTQSPSYVFSYTGNPFTVSGTSLASGGTGVTGVSLVYTNPACSSTSAIALGSEVYQTGSPEVSYALANVVGGASTVDTASLAITTPPPAADGFAFADPTTGQIYMTPEPTATGNFSLTYAYCAPGITLTSDPSGLTDGNCSSATVTYVAAQHCELVGENVTVSISSSDIYQAICSSTVAPTTVTPGQTFTYNTIPGTSVIPVEESTSVGNADHPVRRQLRLRRPDPERCLLRARIGAGRGRRPDHTWAGHGGVLHGPPHRL